MLIFAWFLRKIWQLTWSATLTIPSGLTARADIAVNRAFDDSRFSLELLMLLVHEHGELLLAQSHTLKDINKVFNQIKSFIQGKIVQKMSIPYNLFPRETYNLSLYWTGFPAK